MMALTLPADIALAAPEAQMVRAANGEYGAEILVVNDCDENNKCAARVVMSMTSGAVLYYDGQWVAGCVAANTANEIICDADALALRQKVAPANIDLSEAAAAFGDSQNVAPTPADREQISKGAVKVTPAAIDRSELFPEKMRVAPAVIDFEQALQALSPDSQRVTPARFDGFPTRPAAQGE